MVMIKKTLLSTLFLLICWGLFLRWQPFSLSKHEWQENVISAEKFMFDLDSVDHLIVGSSLARRIKVEGVPDYCNLSLSGQSVFDGLNILRNKKKLPKKVFIEINVMVRDENSNYKEIVSSSILNTLKERSDVFRTDKHPLDYAGEKIAKPIVNALVYKVLYRLRDQITGGTLLKKETQTPKPNQALFGQLLAAQVESYSEHLDTALMNERFAMLKRHVAFLESKGVRVFFFEMPVHHQLVHLTRASYLRDRVLREFPAHKLMKLPENLAMYQTTDGVHLTEQEAKMYTDYFMKEATALSRI
jgi:hypothetical protein